eukprot:5725560-Amphidinium_carterae.1
MYMQLAALPDAHLYSPYKASLNPNVAQQKCSSSPDAYTSHSNEDISSSRTVRQLKHAHMPHSLQIGDAWA